jgi:multidrug efflux pump
MVGLYGRSLRVVLQHWALTLLVFVGTIALTVALYVKTPKGLVSVRRHRPDLGLDPGLAGNLLPGDVRAAAAGERHRARRSRHRRRRLLDRDLVVQFLVNRGQLFISLKPLSERRESAWDVINRLRPQLNAIPGLRVFMFPAQDVRTGGRLSDSSYQYTIWTPDYQDLIRWAPIINDGCRRLRNWSTSPATASRADLQVNVSSTGSRRRGSACAAQDIQARSTTRLRSGRCRRSTPSATNIA